MALATIDPEGLIHSSTQESGHANGGIRRDRWWTRVAAAVGGRPGRAVVALVVRPGRGARRRGAGGGVPHRARAPAGRGGGGPPRPGSVAAAARPAATVGVRAGATAAVRVRGGAGDAGLRRRAGPARLAPHRPGRADRPRAGDAVRARLDLARQAVRRRGPLP